MIKPCVNCHPDLKETCERLAALRKSIKGLGLKAITISCQIIKDYFPPGTRVVAKIYNAYNSEISGTISRYQQRTKKFIVFLDETPVNPIRYLIGDEPESEQEGHGIVKIKAKNLIKLDEPITNICSECGCPEGFENTEKWSCWKCDGEEPPVEFGIGVYI